MKRIWGIHIFLTLLAILTASLFFAAPVQASDCTPPASGIVSWWPGDDNALDVVGVNDGYLVNGLGFTQGEVGQAFDFKNANGYVLVPASPSLNLGTNGGFTLEAWIDPADVSAQRHPIFEWNLGSSNVVNDFGVYFSIDPLERNGPGELFANIVDTNGKSHYIATAGRVVGANQFQHVALTYDQSSGVATIYRNGVTVAQQSVGRFVPQTSYNLYLGRHPFTEGSEIATFAGLLDAPAIYNRALSTPEIKAIYEAGSAGKCPVVLPPPTNCIPPSPDVVSWWPGEGNANDVVGTNNGILSPDVSFAQAEVGQGFLLNDTNAFVDFPASPSLNLGADEGLTVEAWINPSSVTGLHPIVEWDQSTNLIGIQLWIGQHPGDQGVLCTSFMDTNYNNYVQVVSPPGALTANVFQHVAVTYSELSGYITLYINGVMTANYYWGVGLQPLTCGDLWAGHRPQNCGGGCWTDGTYLGGVLDELTIYSRALSSTEIAAIYNAGEYGKCPPPSANSTNAIAAPSGLVGWWKGDGNTLDTVSGIAATGVGVTYTNGVVNQAFSFDPNGYVGVQVADQPAYALTNSMTIEGWIRVRGDGYNIFWRGDNRPGLDPYTLSTQGNNQLWFHICDDQGNGALVAATVNYNEWTHVAATLDGSTGTMSIYTNGVLASQTNTTVRPIGALDPDASPGVGIGNVNDGVNDFPFVGDIDEISLYNRALLPSEVQAIYNAGSAGKYAPPVPPFIVASPVGQTVLQGASVVLSATAGGTQPFSYQWTLNGTNIAGAIDSTLTLTNLHPYQSGNYVLEVISPYGSAFSAPATVTVIAQPFLVYTYSGSEDLTTTGTNTTIAFSGELFFDPATTNGTFVGWAIINGNKQYWVNCFSDYLLIPIAGKQNQNYTFMGKAGTAFDSNGLPHIWSYLHKGQNTTLTFAKNQQISFPSTFNANDTRVFPNPNSGAMTLEESTSTYSYQSSTTQNANNAGQNMVDLVNSLTKQLVKAGYQAQ